MTNEQIPVLTAAERITLCTCRKQDPHSGRCRDRIAAVERILADRIEATR